MASEYDPLALINPRYRKCLQDLRDARSLIGALEAAYRNALNDAQRAKSDLRTAEESVRAIGECLSTEANRISHEADRMLAKVRDDPGVNGSGR
jgi:hypothetical protein